MHHYVKFRRSDGAIVQYGSDYSINAMLAQVDEEHDVLETDGPANAFEDVPSMVIGPKGKRIKGMVSVAVTHWPAVRGHVLRRIDEAAAALTHDPLAAIHAEKLAEAQGGTKSKRARPLLTAEAEATGQPIGDLIETVLGKAEEARTHRHRIEGRRIAAKRGIEQLTDPRAIKAAAQVDWDAA
jgi:hypothetical protein